jgi:hypothetical protein
MSVIIVVMSGFLSGSAGAQKDFVETISRDCRGEIQRYCVNVSPGRGRVLACLYAYSANLTAVCGSALLDAAPELDRTFANLAVAAKECRGDLRAYCSQISPGEGRLLGCLNRNYDKVSPSCKEALKAGGLSDF